MATYPTHKTCNKCKEEKLLEDFYLNTGGRYGRKSICAVCEKQRTADWRKKSGDSHKSKARAYHLSTKYDMTLSDFDQMRVLQNHKCAICGLDELECRFGRLYVDHDHADGEVRKLLCHHCNTGLGMFKDDPDLLHAAIAYLQEHKL